jgi:membrane-bound lytic murein transglycosylase D
MFQRKGLLCCAALLCLLSVSWHSHLAADESLFPQYECVTPNVNFWIKIYNTYTTSQSVVHDNTNLDIVYDVLDIKPYDQPGAREFNRKITDRAKEKYSTILKRLAAGHQPGGDAQAQRVAALFGGSADRETYRRAAENIRCQTGQKDRFLTGLIRSGAYMEQIREIIRSYDLPEDLSYLPHVESSFNVKAYSKFGAAGLWQFMRTTGERFMEVGYVVDERRDPIRATHAAARLLKENYHQLGDWPLALTAYNHGANGMQNAKRIHGSYPQIFKHHHTRLFRFASRNFYSEFLAARHVAIHYKDYFGDVTFDQPRAIQTVALDGYCSFDEVRSHFGLDAAELMDLNPALRPPVLTGQKLIPKGYVLNLPRYTGEAQTPLLAVIPAAFYQSSQKPSSFYTVQAGDTAGKIAQKHRVPLSSLLAANNLNQRSILYPRQTLRIPAAGDAVASRPPAVETRIPVIAAGAETPGKKLPAIAVAKPAASSPTAVVNVSKQPPAITENVFETASPPAENDQPPADIALDLPPESRSIETAAIPEAQTTVTGRSEPSPETLSTNGQAFSRPILAAVIPIPADIPPGADSSMSLDTRPNMEIVAADVQVENLGTINGIPMGLIRLEIEETLGHIADWARVRTQKIRDLNGLRFDTAVQLGQKIKIPLNKVSAETFVEQRYEFHKRLQEDFFAVYRIGRIEAYRVKPGDTYWSLCREKFEIPLWLLKQCNPGVDLSRLTMQQILMIPTIEKSTDNEPGLGTPDHKETDPDAPDHLDEEIPEKYESSHEPQQTS